MGFFILRRAFNFIRFILDSIKKQGGRGEIFKNLKLALSKKRLGITGLSYYNKAYNNNKDNLIVIPGFVIPFILFYLFCIILYLI